MKKSIALIGASVLGLGAPVALAAPAQAAPGQPVPTCDTASELNPGTIDAVAGWYGPCTPLYGLGKAEFTISSDVDFPEDFAALDDPSVVVTRTEAGDTAQLTPEELGQYFGSEAPIDRFDNLERVDGSDDPRSQTYRGDAPIAIAGVEEVPLDDISADCAFDGTYLHAYQVTYEKTTYSFTQQVDGEEWRYDVVVNSEPLVVALADTESSPYAFCASVGDRVYRSTNTGGLSQDNIVIGDVLSSSSNGEDDVYRALSPFAVPDPFAYRSIGDFPRVTQPVPVPVPVPVDPAPAGEETGPVLAETGADVLPVVGAAGVLGLLGGALLVARRRRNASRV